MASPVLSRGARLAQICLDHCQDCGEPPPTRAVLATMLGCSERQVSRYLAELRQAGK
jgi:biotin operon repressor